MKKMYRTKMLFKNTRFVALHKPNVTSVSITVSLFKTMHVKSLQVQIN